MNRFIKNHEEIIMEAINRGEVTAELYEYHCMKLSWLQHERISHLIVLALVSLLLAAFISLMLITELFLVYTVAAVFAVLEFFYIVHYYKLENTVQKWYRTGSILWEALSKTGRQ